MTDASKRAVHYPDARIRELCGCPLRKNVFGRLICFCSGCDFEDVTNYIMCDVDWESCADYQKQIKRKGIN